MNPGAKRGGVADGRVARVTIRLDGRCMFEAEVEIGERSVPQVGAALDTLLLAAVGRVVRIAADGPIGTRHIAQFEIWLTTP